jgi:hypothetical protein
MQNQFEMTDMGLLTYFLGLEIKQTSASVFVSQEKYAENFLTKFGTKGCKSDITPMNRSDKLLVDDGSDKENELSYRSLVGGLIYLTHTRSNLAYAVNMVSRFMQHPSRIHFGATRIILKYVA